ncbi:MAG: hypothetical protein ACI4DN_01450 [Lachnospiraceae bacterium]
MGLIILQVLKWILWIGLWIIAAIFVLLLLLLFVPIRYRVEGEYGEAGKKAEGRLRWLLSIVYFTFRYEEVLIKKLKLFGITVYDSSKPKKKKEKEITGFACRPEEIPASEPAKVFKEASPQPAKVYKNIGPQQAEEEKAGLWEKGKAVKAGFLSFNRRWKALGNCFQDKQELIHEYYSRWKREETQRLWARVKVRTLKVLSCLAPRRWRINGVAGFEDPSVTGQMMAAVGITYPLHRGNLQITPDFETGRMEFNGYARGRIFLGVLLYHMLILICNKDCMALIKLWLNGPSDDNLKENDDTNYVQEVRNDR